MADFGATESSELAAFRAEARAWLEANLPASLRKDPEAVTRALGGGGVEEAGEKNADVDLWRQRIGA
jgi:hypothetical protein